MSFLVSVLLDPYLTTHHSIIGVLSRRVTELGLLILSKAQVEDLKQNSVLYPLYDLCL